MFEAALDHCRVILLSYFFYILRTFHLCLSKMGKCCQYFPQKDLSLCHTSFSILRYLGSLVWLTDFVLEATFFFSEKVKISMLYLQKLLSETVL